MSKVGEAHGGVLGRYRQEDQEFQVSLGCTLIPRLKKRDPLKGRGEKATF